ncbi:MAG: beta-CASP ribonuclease aCPSF1 [Thermoplasmata archaeon]
MAEWEDILKQTRNAVEDNAHGVSITSIDFEGSVIVVYTKDIDYFSSNPDTVKKIAQTIRRRVSIRPDPSLLMPEEEARAEILKIVPEEGGIVNIFFDQENSEALIEADAPGIVIGKDGYLLNEIKKRVHWSPKVVRAPPIPSLTVREIREYLKMVKDERKQFLKDLGIKLNSPPLSGENWVRILALGGFREVGRSSSLIMTRNSKILVDCGLNVSVIKSDEPWAGIPYLYVPEVWTQSVSSNRKGEFNPFETIDAVVLTHAHIDHSGLIPFLYKHNYRGPIYLTPPTRDLTTLLLTDYLKLTHAEGEKVPYDSKDIKEMLKRTITVEYGETTDITKDVRLTFQNAGHILGSAQVHLHIGEGLYNIVFTGDLKYEKSWLFNAANTKFPRVETLVIESTYAGHTDYQPSRKEAGDNLKNLVSRVIEKGGKVLVPVFAVGRSQEVMLVLEEGIRNGQIPKIPVYLDGMIWEATAIHAAYPEYLNKELRESIFHKKENPFLSDVFVRVDNSERRSTIVNDPAPAVILATAGMMNGGPIIEYFKYLAQDPINALVFVGYQAEGTFGRRIQKGEKEVTLSDHGKMIKIPINMEIATIDGFSGHSDRKQLIQYISSLSSRPDRVITCHGDAENCIDLARTVNRRYNIESFSMQNLDTLRLK